MDHPSPQSLTGFLHPERVADLRERRRAYHEQVRAYVQSKGQSFVDKAISAEGAAFILDVLEQRLRLPDPLRVLDMGLGFSTVFIGEWIGHAARPSDVISPAEYVGFDHDQAWVRFVEGLIVAIGFPPFPRHLLTDREHVTHAAVAGADDGFDVIVVDHGDEQGTDLSTRAKDTPWLTTLLRPGGVMLFDDWRPKHEGRIRRALGEGWTIGAAEWTRRFPRDKAIGWAMKA